MTYQIIAQAMSFLEYVLASATSMQTTSMQTQS